MRKTTYFLLFFTVSLGVGLMAFEFNLSSPWGADLLRKTPESTPPPQAAAIVTPAPRIPVAQKSSSGLARLATEPGNPQLLAQMRAAIKANRNLPQLESILRDALKAGPQHVELNELIGDIFLQEGRQKEALESYENSETSENDFALLPKLIRLYGEVMGGEAVDKYLSRMDKSIVERSSRKNQPKLAVEAREQAALTICKARYLRQLEMTDSENSAYTAFSGCKQHFAESDPEFLKRYGKFEPDATAWARDLPPR